MSIKAFKTIKVHRAWILLAGMLSVAAVINNFKLGICVLGLITLVLGCINRPALMAFWLIFFAFLLPFNYYLAMHGGWAEYMNTILRG